MYNIGLIVGNVEDPFSNQVCQGAMKAAETLGDNLFIFPVKYLNLGDNIKNDIKQQFEYQYNFLLGYAQSHSLDMIILCISTIAYRATKEEAMEVVKSFDGIPVFLLSSNVEGYSSIMFDNVTGLKEGIQYLIDERGCKNIGMVSGDLDKTDAIERFNVYKEVLAQNGLEYEDKKVVYGDFSIHCVEQVEELLHNNLKLDAIVCANDCMAMTTCEVLKKYNYNIGKDICVIGFDDLEQSERMCPPLATIRADATVMGYQSVIEVHDILKDKEKNGKREVSIRKSFVDTKFINRESASGQKEVFPVDVDSLKREYEKKFQRMIDVNHCLNRLTRDMLMYCDAGNGNYSYFLDSFKLERNTSCYLYMLDEPLEFRAKGNYSIEKRLYLQAYKLNGKVVEFPKYEKEISMDHLFDSEYYEKKPKNYIIIDIYSCEMQHGIMVCDITHKDFRYVENLCYLIGIAAKIINLLQIQEQLLSEKEAMLKSLEQENLILGDISYKDELTGINNRRGFIAKTMEFIKNRSNDGKVAALVYIDLNYLKLINDRFSHAEGNVAIQTCANALTYIGGEDGIVGRIGGDEFTMFMPIPYCGAGECLREQINCYLDEFNENSQKPYEVSASIGIQEIIIDSDCDLKKILEMADKRLYEDKAHKKPFVER